MTNDMDNKEWLDKYKSLKQVSTINPFTVPAGYFDELGERILSGIKLDELKNTITADGFTVPSNYFEELGNMIQSRTAIEDKLNTKNIGFIVPDNYFEELAGNIQSRIAVEAKLNTENTGFTIPENYFENLQGQIQTRLLAEEILTKEEGFTIPPNYFNELNTKILNKTVAHDAVKRKGAVIRFITSTAFKYATAACVVLVVGAGLLFNPSVNTTSSHNSSYLHKELANIPVDDIQDYIELNVDANDTQHTIDIEDLPVNDADLKAALQDYVDDNK